MDEARIHVEGGRGGDGCVSFRREKYRPKGGPDGGSGGDGGCVFVEASLSRGTLAELHRKPRYRAHRGSRGGRNDRTGGRGEDLTVMVPPGTVVKDADGEVLADLVHSGQRFLAARGGRGGRGNTALVREAGPIPRFAERGEPGESRLLLLELKLVADVAIVGFPNSGKSTLISRISNSKPKIADYPFTTTEPNLGVVSGEEIEYVVTDVPGLIPGAHEGRGMGIDFLRHIERAPVIVYLVDMSPESGRPPDTDLVVLEDELGAFNPGLLERRRLVVANKMDLRPPREAVESLMRECSARDLGLEPISAVTGENLRGFLETLEGMVREAREGDRVADFEVTYTHPADADMMRATRRGDRFVVEGAAVERMVHMTDLNNEEARAHLSERLRRLGVEDLLAKRGAVRGDEVEIAGRVFEYLPDDEVESGPRGGPPAPGEKG